MRISWLGLAVFVGFCFLLWAALSNAAWTPLIEGVATVLILVGFAALFVPKLKKTRGGL